MNQNLHSPTKLTEFARDFDDEPETLFGRFVYKIQNVYNQSYNSVNELPNNNNNNSSNNTTPTDSTQSSCSKTNNTNNKNNNNSSSTSSSSITSFKPQRPNVLPLDANTKTIEEKNNDKVTVELPMEASEGRTMVNVLKRISNLMASKNNDLRNYKDTDLHKFWMPDSKAIDCYDCEQRFNTFRRKHHCRLCGQIFCSKCCNQVVPGKIILCSGDLKVCNYCSKIVLSYLKSPNITVDLHSDLQALQQDLSNKLEECDNVNDKLNTLQSTNFNDEFSPRKMSVGYQEERFANQHVVNNLSEIERKNILQQSQSLITLHEEMSKSLPAQNSGIELIEFLQNHHKSSNKIQAVAILCAMLSAGFLQPIVPDSEEMDFDENLHYKFNLNVPNQGQDLKLLKYSDLSENVVIASTEPQPPKSIESSSMNYQSSTMDVDMANTMLSSSITSKLLEAYCEHEEQLLAQMLRTCHLDLRWSKVLLPLCCGAANHFKSEYCTNDLMDIRNYVNFKKVPGGKRQECVIVGGVVFSKNVAHKDMAKRVELPRVLLLQCAIVYERIEGKFVSISTVVLQEKEYLRNVCARIMSFKPNVILVHKNVAGVAQDILRSHGITLVLDVKLSVLERLSRTLQCDILTSIESNLSKPRLGLCDVFYIQSFNDGAGSCKTLMFFEKLNSPRGYTCLLRGGHNNELKRVKKVASFLMYARYNWRLEMSFLLDEFAQAQEPKPAMFDTQDSNTDMENSQVIKRLPEKRKIENKKYLRGISENVPENMDPLRCNTDTDTCNVNTLQKSEFCEEIATLEVEKPYDNRFRNALNSTILSISPFVNFPLPYLETEHGRNCALRALFPKELYFSKQWSNMERPENMEIIQNTNNNNNNNESKNHEIKLNPLHKFLRLKITKPADDRLIQKLLAEFRAMGCRYPKRNELFKIAMLKQEIQKPQKLCDNHVYKDALDLENHQRLPVLFCSFYNNQKTGSSFCAPPTLLNMKFYGHQDIMLKQFLQRYCCRLSAICPLCNLPMLNHVRRYVHSLGCVQVFLSEDIMKTDPNRIFFTAWCSTCKEMTPSVPLSETSKCLSLAKYLELRFHAHSYKRRAFQNNDDNDDDNNDINIHDNAKNLKCQHSLHRDYIHYFSYRGVGAKFHYRPIMVWEIGLPSLRLKLQIPKTYNKLQVLDDVKSFSIKGHEIFTSIHERIADLALEDENSPLLVNLKTIFSKDQLYFKSHVETVQQLLTDSKSNIYDINDAILMAKRVLCASLEEWEPRVQEIALAQKQAAKQQSQQQQQIISAQLPLDDNKSDNNIETEQAVAADDKSPSLPDIPENSIFTQAEDFDVDETTIVTTAPIISTTTTATSTNIGNIEKKSIKKLLINLLPSMGPAVSLQSPFKNQEHYTLPLGVFPILVHDHDLGSIIAYSLTSMDYQRAKAALTLDTTNNLTNNSTTTTTISTTANTITTTTNTTITEKESSGSSNNNINSPHLKPKIQEM